MKTKQSTNIHIYIYTKQTTQQHKNMKLTHTHNKIITSKQIKWTQQRNTNHIKSNKTTKLYEHIRNKTKTQTNKHQTW